MISTLLYASTEETYEEHQKPDPNMYEPFRVMNDSITRNVELVMAAEEEEGSASTGQLRPTKNDLSFVRPLTVLRMLHIASTSLVTALCKALCCSSPRALSSVEALLTALRRRLPADINRLHHSPSSVNSSIAMGVSSNGASQLPPSKTGATSSSAARTAEEASHNARILIVSASEEESSGYVSLMNCIFSAQKAVRLP